MTDAMSDDSFSVSHQEVTETYLKAIGLIDDRVTPFLGKATTRALVQGAAKRVTQTYPFLHFLVTIPYTDVIPSIVQEQLSGVSRAELVSGLDALLQECFAGLKELTGNLIAPPIHDEVTRQLKELQ